jgi:Cd2+/Zn2+-exporting ATPase
MLTGESKPVSCAAGSEVFSGTVSLDGLLLIKTTKSSSDSSAARIIQLVESAQEAKARPERFITSFARVYTPIVTGCAVLLAVLPPLLMPDARFADWFYRALVLLVISCPCALVVSVPLGYFAGIGGMSRRGIMVKGALHLDSLCKTKFVAFDKTGTLTRGKFSIAALEPAPGASGETLLATAVLAEQESNHPIARAILEYAQNLNEKPEIENDEYKKFKRFETAGQGVELVSENEKILAGNRRLFEANGIDLSVLSGAGEAGAFTQVLIAKGGKYLGRILIGDTLKDGASQAISLLKDMGIKSAMLTGDTLSSARDTALRLGIDSVKAELLPEDKLREVEKLTQAGTTVFVGDGINDAPVLARAHVGIAMGSGADAAVEAADVIVMTDDPRRIPEAIAQAGKTRKIIAGNVAFALAAKGVFIVLAGLGMANMWIALIADVGVALMAILNSTRALK